MAEDGLWPFVLRLYGTAGVPEACLVLQDRDGADVTQLLWAAWAGAARGRALDAAAAERAAAAVAEWHAEVVRPLRAVRRRMKDGPAPAPSDATEALRDKLKAVEIGSERIELSVLEALDLPDATGTPGAELASVNIGLLLARLAPGAPASDPSRAAVATIARAAQQASREGDPT